MQEKWLRSAAVAGWMLGFAVIVGLAFDSASWLLLLGVGGFAGGATASVMAVCRVQARENRRAMYRNRRWDDQPQQENVHQLFG